MQVHLVGMRQSPTDTSQAEAEPQADPMAYACTPLLNEYIHCIH